MSHVDQTTVSEDMSARLAPEQDPQLERAEPQDLGSWAATIEELFEQYYPTSAEYLRYDSERLRPIIERCPIAMMSLPDSLNATKHKCRPVLVYGWLLSDGMVQKIIRSGKPASEAFTPKAHPSYYDIKPSLKLVRHSDKLNPNIRDTWNEATKHTEQVSRVWHAKSDGTLDRSWALVVCNNACLRVGETGKLTVQAEIIDSIRDAFELPQNSQPGWFIHGSFFYNDYIVVS